MRAALAFAALALTAFAALADPEDSEVSPATRDPDYAAGKQAIEGKDWAEAVSRFGKAALRFPDNADVQNYLGFAHRNLGRYEPAFRHYRRALELDPRHKGAHEYIGETYLKVGDLASAMKHVGELKRLCPLGCEQLEDLEKAVTEYRRPK